VAVDYANGEVRLWEVATGQLLRHWNGGGACLAFSPDGRILAGGQADALQLYEVLTGRVIASFKRDQGAIAAVVFAPDGRTVATAGPDRVVRIWDLASGRQLHSFTGHQGGVIALDFAPDGRRLASGSEDGTVLVWDATRPHNPRAPHEPGAKELDALWAHMGGEDAENAFRALWTFVESPKQSVPFVAGHLHPVPGIDPKRLARLFADLDDDTFDVREKATTELKQAAESVEDAVRKEMARTKSEEVRQRLGQVLDAVDRTVAAPGHRALPSRALLVLEHAGTPEARQALEKLAGGAPGAWLTTEAKAALARIARRSAP
jgi:hypothetical protein